MVVLHPFRKWVIHKLALYISCRQECCNQMSKLCPAQEYLVKGKENKIKMCTLVQDYAHERKRRAFFFFFPICTKVPVLIGCPQGYICQEGASFLNLHKGTLWVGSALLVGLIYRAHGTSIMW